jgi:hypothetical protein
MSFANLIRGAVKTAHKITSQGELQETITLKRWVSENSGGVRTYAADLPVSAIVDHKSRAFRTKDGIDRTSTAQVVLLDPIETLTVTGRKEPVDERDQVVLADGTVGVVMGVDGGVVDPATGYGYVTMIYLGEVFGIIG